MEAVSAGNSKFGACTAMKNTLHLAGRGKNYMGWWRKASIGKEPTRCLQEAVKGRAGYYWLIGKHRTIESFALERTLKITESNC